jgi:hypothetical protein
MAMGRVPMGEHRIEFEPGEVIKPDFSPENDLVGIYINDAGLESLREAVCPPQTPDETSEEPGSTGPSEGELVDTGSIDLGMVLVEFEVRVPPEMSER